MSGRHGNSEAHTVVVTRRDSDGTPSSVERWPTSREFDVVNGHLLVYDSTDAAPKPLIAVYAPRGWLTAYIDSYTDT
jgi:hypothetical protein